MLTLSLVLPVYNEEARLPRAISHLLAFKSSATLQLTEVVFVNDGSTDNTLTLLKKAQQTLAKKLKINVKIITYQRNRGKGYAVKQGMLKATGDYTLLTDVDFSTPLSEIKKFATVLEKNTPVLVGTRKVNRAKITKAQPMHRQLLGRCFTLLSNIILNTWVSDFTCGFKFFHRTTRHAIFKISSIERWGYDAEILFIARKMNFEIVEIPVRWHNDERSKVNVLKASIQSLLELWQIRHNQLTGLYMFPTPNYWLKLRQAFT